MLKALLASRQAAVLFSLMFSIVCLLNINYNILRSARNALAIADLGGSAESIPIFELFGTMPASVLMAYLLTKLLNRYSIHKVFFITLSTFCAFFLFFSFGLYPYWKTAFISYNWLLSSSFFVMAELWKIALLTVLFWGLVNQYMPLHDAKKYYAPLMLGGSVGTILAGPIISFCTSDFASAKSWTHSLELMMLMVSIFGLLTALLYKKLWKEFGGKKAENETQKPSLSLWESIQACMQSRYLFLLGWITIADYIAYAVGEIIFLDVLKQKYPNPRDYCEYMGLISSWSGFLTAFSALVITPLVLKRCRWVVASMITPACILLTETLFFYTLYTPNDISLAVFSGTLFFCLARAAKYTLFDSSKEISFLLLPPLEKMQGKLVVDGMCSRVGRAGASMVSIAFSRVCGGVLASSYLAGPVVIFIGLSCVSSTFKLGKLVERKANA